MTPQSWHQTGGSSVGGASGQISMSNGTKMVRSSRTIVIAVVATLIVAAGGVGFVIANNMGSKEVTHVSAPNPLEATMSTDKADPPKAAEPAKPVVADPPKPVVADPPKPADPVTAKPDVGAAMGGAIKTDPPKEPAKETPAKETPKEPPKATIVKSTPSKETPKATTKATTTKTKPKDDGGLFDDRH
jgi:hypothetical protein